MSIATVDPNFPVGTNIDQFDIGLLSLGTVSGQSDTSYSVTIGYEIITFSGTGITYSGGLPTGGSITGIQDSYFGQNAFNIQGINVDVSALNAFVSVGDNLGAKSAIFAGNDTIVGGPLDDLLRSYDGNDSISGG